MIHMDIVMIFFDHLGSVSSTLDVLSFHHGVLSHLRHFQSSMICSLLSVIRPFVSRDRMILFFSSFFPVAVMGLDMGHFPK